MHWIYAQLWKLKTKKEKFNFIVFLDVYGLCSGKSYKLSPVLAKNSMKLLVNFVEHEKVEKWSGKICEKPQVPVDFTTGLK